MKTDLYTKTVLTVIAIALCTIAFRNINLIDPAKADSKNIMSDEINVNIAHIGGGSIGYTLPINIKEMNGNSFYGNLPINLKEVNGTSVNMNGIPVNIEAVNGSDIYDAVPVKNK